MWSKKEESLPSFMSNTLLFRLLSTIYGKVVDIRNRWYEKTSHIKKLNTPVISIGGIRAGGIGKTPSVMLLIELLSKRNYEIAVLSRGYKRKNKKSIILEPEQEFSIEQIGDEPVMIRRNYPYVWLGIDANRYKCGLRISERIGNKKPIFILDDGFQHRRLYRDIDIVCIHDTLLTDKLLPVGFLREPYSYLSRAHIFFMISTKKGRESLSNISQRLHIDFPNVRQFFLDYKVEGWVNLKTGSLESSLPLKNPVAICGIARPERFFEFLSECGISTSEEIVFPDHYFYKESDFCFGRKLYSDGIVTTEKDAVRLLNLKNIPHEKVWFLKMRLRFTENQSSEIFINYIMNIVNK
ncbi:MAG: tetraacyldisaccharide 4'-kinase [Chitinispirillaceae bacterium]|nr:tetraacyldisaccharide 4'-kinase [Chitinispirillaceae bacterium]